MMMGDSWDTRFSNKFSEREANWYVHGYGQGVFRNDEIDVEFLNEVVEGPFELLRHRVDRIRCFPFSGFCAEQVAVNILNHRMFKVGFLAHVSPFRRSVRKPGEIETIISVPFQNICPFLNLQRNPVCPCDSRGYETDVFDDTVKIL